MPRIFDNIEKQLLPALQKTLETAKRADFCVGYFNLRGWRELDRYFEDWGGGRDECCRVLVGMQTLPQDELKQARSLTSQEGQLIDQQTVLRLRKKAAEDFRAQLTIGAPTNQDEAALRRLNHQLKAGKVKVKLHLRHTLHAKLYLLYRPDDYNNPVTGFLGSSNLTFAGLSKQGELNVDVLESDACQKLVQWFEDRWEDKWSLDISDELIDIIDNSWAREKLLPPYHIYVKMAYHLSHEARAGLAEYSIPRDFGNKLFDFQVAAVKIAAHHINKRGGVLVGDVVGLGKTLMATAIARIFQDDYGMETLIICPKNLVKMWEQYKDDYRLFAKILSVSQVVKELPNLKRYRLVLIDESHNLRNREGKRFGAIRDYIEKNDSKCILLTATPYNKTYLDLSAQLRLFIPEEQDLGIRPEKLLSEIGELEFQRRHQALPRTLAAFEKSEFPDDWRDLMRLFMVRRTRSFIQENYAGVDKKTGRQFLTLEDGTLSYFPTRQPHTLKFTINDSDPSDPYARLYADEVVTAINALRLPRYGLGNYAPYLVKGGKGQIGTKPTEAEKNILENLGRAGQRLMGFSRTNLFKRLESGGPTFIQSIERHILRNFVFIHALENGLDLPLGAQDNQLLDARSYDEDAETALPGFFENDEEEAVDPAAAKPAVDSETAYRQRAAQVYAEYACKYKGRFKWLRSQLFMARLKNELLDDARALLEVRQKCGAWNAHHDAKLAELIKLLTKDHPHEKILIFSQFADTVRYLVDQLKGHGLKGVEGVTGDSSEPTSLAWRFSPESNGRKDQLKPGEELRVLVATDVLSEGQNLQDGAIVVNYDLPWAIIRLIQRVGRVDRIGQKASRIHAYSFLPADGVERIIRLRSRVRQRLQQNAEVVGTDEAFFEDDENNQAVVNLYNEKAGILDGEADNEVDLASYAYQIWKNATDADPFLKTTIASLPEVVYSTRQYVGTPSEPPGALLYMRTAEGNDSLAWIDRAGRSVTQSQLAILRKAECSPNTPAIPRYERHHELVEQGVRQIAEEEKNTGGQLGRPGGARFRTYERLKNHAERLQGTLFQQTEEYELLLRAIDQIYRYPMRQTAIDTLNRQLKSSIQIDDLVTLVISLYQDDRLCIVHQDGDIQEPKIICSLGLSD